MNRASVLRLVALAVMGLGAALLTAAVLLTTYTAGKIEKIPLDIDETLVSSGTGTALDPASLSATRFVIDANVPLVSQQAITVETPANAQVVTLQVGTSVRRTDRQQENGLLLAMVDTVTLNRRTAQAVSDDERPGGSVQKPRTFDDDKPSTNIALPHEGLAYRFPFNTEKKSYSFFDAIAQKPFDANYDGEDDVNGLTTYRFTQNVGYDADGKLVDPIKYASLYDRNEDGEVTARAELWGLPGDPYEPITMTRFYAAQRTFWVDPVTGVVVKEQEHANHYYARDPLNPEMALADYTVTSTEQTVESQVAAARDERDRVALWSRILPISFTAAGLVALVGAGLLAWFSVRVESALAGPGEDDIELGIFGKDETGPMAAAQAPTEKIPTRRPEQPPAQR
ncbi:DUF3068 domain-containing protein [Mycolicibacterium sp.]|uniref:DUF3068 domain-containing protein n=1 Tax=Mycolicibacterium sp. TaxID=2320850 RepID=UPI001A1FE923|nr:DUF3068 domain-containing protein [Mycolicibacterium sp.]MBJ7399498.1 DUF3068 domain-containing protein [Mycolicibacterium sp.]